MHPNPQKLYEGRSYASGFVWEDIGPLLLVRQPRRTETLVGKMLNPKTNTLNVVKYRLSIYISKNGIYEQIPGRGQVRTGRGQVQDGQVEDR